jgi:hypothetical protein
MLFAICALGLFIAVKWTTIQRGYHIYAASYLTGLGVVVLCAYACAGHEHPLKSMIRAVVAPVAGSFAGYVLLTVQFYIGHQYLTRGVSAYDWLVAATVFSYLGGRAWFLTVILMTHPLFTCLRTRAFRSR